MEFFSVLQTKLQKLGRVNSQLSLAKNVKAHSVSIQSFLDKVTVKQNGVTENIPDIEDRIRDILNV